MLSLIGGMMLSCAVGAMILLAAWSLARDDDPDTAPRDGILALRDWSARALGRKEPQRQPATPRKTARQDRKPAREQAAPSRRTEFDPDEMDAVAREIHEAEFRREFGMEKA